MIEIFFWSPTHRPESFVREDVDTLTRFALIGILNSGRVLHQYRGMATCRYPGCLRSLGSADLTGYGYKWPAGAEHYVFKHKVWVPGCDELIAKAIKDAG